jgi:hypothetical protein
MRNQITRYGAAALAVVVLMLAGERTAVAQHAIAGGGHVSGHSGFAAPGARGYGGYWGHPGYGGYGGYRGYGGYGWHGYWGGYGWGYRGYGWGCCWGWGWGWPALYLATLPWYYSTYWWGGVPYYYADNAYYQWNGTNGYYEQVQPPFAAASQQTSGGPPPTSAEVFAYPRNGQSPAQQETDKSQCRAWAAGQTGFNPATPNVAPGKQQDYLRAQVACLEGRGYSAR